MEKRKQEQALILNPEHELHFKGPFDEIVTRVLALTNPTNKKICFKVKTTAPKRYCVRPNSGFIEPDSTTNVAVMLQPLLNLDPAQIAVEFKNKHKFMIQSIFVENSCDKEPNWKDVDNSLIMDSKLRCVFEFKAEQDSAIEPTVNDTNALMTSVSSTIKPLDASSVSPSVAPPSTQQSAQPTQNNDKDIVEENQQLKNQIAKLREEITNLNSNLPSLRQRHLNSPGNSGSVSIDETNLSPFQRLTFRSQIQLLLVVFFIGLFVGASLF